MNRLKNLEIWQRAITLSTDIYRATSTFPETEKYGLVSQLRRCVISIASNIAKGAGRNTNKDFKRFLSLAYGSAYELETQLIIASNLDLLDEQEGKKICNELDELQKMIYVFSKNLKTR